MGVLIKDMLMPKDCVFCPMAHWNKLDEITGCEIVIGKKFVDKTDRDFWYGDSRPKWCPLEESAERTGHWRRVGARVDLMECSACGYRLDVESYTYPSYRYCPNCGCRMKGEEE